MAGFISKIELENFMSHRKFEIQLSPSMNVIVGRNGSGKSSILTALIVGLGGGARATGRGDNFRALIRHGCNDAYIRITLVATRGGPFLDQFGSPFTIQRRIGKKTASYTIKNSEGKTISTKAQDIRNICLHFGYHPDNTLVMLNQESAKEFLVTATPKQKYLRLKKALQVDTFFKAMEQADSFIQRRKEQREDMMREYKLLQASAKTEENTLEATRRLQESSAAVEELRAVEAWREVRKFETKLEGALAAAEEARVAAAAAEDRPLSAEKALSLRLLELEHEKELAGPLAAEAARTLEEEKARAIAARGSLAEATLALDKVNRELSRVKEELQELLTRQTPNAGEQTARLRAELQALNDKHAELQRQQPELEAEINELDEAHRKKMARVREIDKEAKNIRASISEQELILRGYRAGPVDPLLGFGNDKASIRRLDSLIERQNFRVKPVGPLARYMRCTDKNWARLIETVARHAAWIYWVQHPQDRNKLQQLVREAGLESKITTLMWTPELFEYTRLPPSPQYRRFLDCIQFENEYIERIFVDQISPEQDVFCDSLEEAIEVSARAGARYAYTHNKRGDGWSRLSRNNNSGNRENRPVSAPTYRVHLQGAAADSPEAAKQAIRDRIQEFCEKEAEVLARKQEAEAEAAALNAQITKLYTKKERLQGERVELEKQIKRVSGSILELEQSETTLDIETLSENKRRLQRQREIEVRSCGNLVNKRAAELAPLDEAVKAQEAELERRNGAIGTLAAEIRRLADEQEKQRREQIARQSRQATAERHLLDAGARVEELQGDLEAELERASSLGPRPDLASFDHLNSEEIRSEIIRLEAQVEQLERAEIDFEQREQELATLRADLENLGRDCKRRARELEQFETNSKRRKVNARRQFDLKMEEIRAAYKQFISQRNFSGDLAIDQIKETLVASANPVRAGNEARSTTTLSGGEKSFTQICLLLSVWSKITTGLVAMDEYDVFMDEVFRAASMEALVQTITGKDAQGILITPQGLPHAIVEQYRGTNVFKVHNLESPR